MLAIHQQNLICVGKQIICVTQCQPNRFINHVQSSKWGFGTVAAAAEATAVTIPVVAALLLPPENHRESSCFAQQPPLPSFQLTFGASSEVILQQWCCLSRHHSAWPPGSQWRGAQPHLGSPCGSASAATSYYWCIHVLMVISSVLAIEFYQPS